MQENTTTYRNEFGEEAESLTEKVSSSVGNLKERVTGIGRTAADKIDQRREAAAGGLERAATTLSSNAEKVSRAADTGAEKLAHAADYVREHDVNRMMSDVGTMVKNNPGPSLLIAAVVGFLLGRSFSSSD